MGTRIDLPRQHRTLSTLTDLWKVLFTVVLLLESWLGHGCADMIWWWYFAQFPQKMHGSSWACSPQQFQELRLGDYAYYGQISSGWNRPPSRMPWYHLGYWRSLGELETTSFNCNLNLLIHPEQQLDLWLLIILIPIRNTFLYCSKRCRRSKNNGSAPNRIFRGSIWGWGLRYSDQVAEVIPGYLWGMRPVFFGWIDGSIFQISPFLDFLGDFWIDLELVPVFPVAIWIWVGKTGFIPTSDKRFLGGFTYFCSQSQQERADHPDFSRVPTSQEDFESNDTWQLSAQDQTHWSARPRYPKYPKING